MKAICPETQSYKQKLWIPSARWAVWLISNLSLSRADCGSLDLTWAGFGFQAKSTPWSLGFSINSPKANSGSKAKLCGHCFGACLFWEAQVTGSCPPMPKFHNSHWASCPHSLETSVMCPLWLLYFNILVLIGYHHWLHGLIVTMPLAPWEFL